MSRSSCWAWAQMVTEIAARVAPIIEVLTAAADADRDAAQLVADADRDRMFGATAFIRYLASLDGLAPGITQQHSTDLCWALMDAHLYRRLVAQCGWTTSDYTQWLSSSLTATLLRTP